MNQRNSCCDVRKEKLLTFHDLSDIEGSTRVGEVAESCVMNYLIIKFLVKYPDPDIFLSNPDLGTVFMNGRFRILSEHPDPKYRRKKT